VRKAEQRAAIFSDRRRYGREVALPSGASYGRRIGVNIVFMPGFGIPVTERGKGARGACAPVMSDNGHAVVSDYVQQINGVGR